MRPSISPWLLAGLVPLAAAGPLKAPSNGQAGLELPRRSVTDNPCDYITDKCVTRVVNGQTPVQSLWATRSCVTAATCNGVTPFLQKIGDQGKSVDPASEDSLADTIWAKMLPAAGGSGMTFDSFELWFIGSLQFYGQYGFGIRDADALVWWQPIAQWTGFCTGDQCRDGVIPYRNFNDWLHYAGKAPTPEPEPEKCNQLYTDYSGSHIGAQKPLNQETCPLSDGSGCPTATSLTRRGDGYEADAKRDQRDDDEVSESDLAMQDWVDRNLLTSGYHFGGAEGDAVRVFFNRTQWDIERGRPHNFSLLAEHERMLHPKASDVVVNIDLGANNTLAARGLERHEKRLSVHIDFDCSVIPEVCENMCYGLYCKGHSLAQRYRKNGTGCNDLRKRNRCKLEDPNYCSSRYPAEFTVWPTDRSNPGGYSCDEFPFASTQAAYDNNDSSRIATRCVPASQNSSQGKTLQAGLQTANSINNGYYTIGFINNKASNSFCSMYAFGNAPPSGACNDPAGQGKWGDEFGWRSQF
ncbi:uncharacterized protein PFL1_00693 [Pseudozyma flocculosa PF-1]|uniref:uncharacterized protein n=1 Tax=Pseudozyma flocculosa PF-1 TaxID=1277687 RepID=UPI0004560773|nr:uncharacterized protein PFL1_00693 [Pseudozyma flocculosa PF-1]EPQ31358.1 hypothetical protein PFL1_00693 [Pseudozyma flocculosa PF-1]